MRSPRKPLTSEEKKHIFKRTTKLVTGQGVRFPLALIAGLIGSLSMVATSFFIRLVIDEVITPMVQGQLVDFGPLNRIMLTMTVVLGASVLATYYGERTMSIIAQDVTHDLRKKLFAHVQKLPMDYFHREARGDIMSRFSNDVDTLVETLSHSVPSVFNSMVTVLGVLVAMLVLNWQLSLIIIVLIAGMALLMRKLASRSGAYFSKQQASIGKVNAHVEEYIEGQRVVQVFQYQDRALDEFEVLNQQLRHDAFQANRYANMMMPIAMNMGNMLYVAVAVIGGILAMRFHSLTLGDLAAFMQLTKSISMPLNLLSQNFNSILLSMAGIGRIYQVLDEEEEPAGGEVHFLKGTWKEGAFMPDKKGREAAWGLEEEGTLIYKPVQGAIRFEHVDFGYEPDQLILKDVSFEAEAGHRVAFVGSTGAGKTTIISLITRFYEINSGTITVDGMDIRRFGLWDLRNSIASVLQESVLFTGTIRDNIRYGRLDATDEEVEEAAKLANAHSFIEMLPHGYETRISGDGQELSKGQKQLLSIARAAVADPQVLILDEATSSIDTRTEQLVQNGMARLMEGRTVLVIAHRLSTIRNADTILVIEGGQIIERGTHDELMDRQGIYYSLQVGTRKLA